MKRLLMCMFLLPACLGSVPLASATWGSFVSTGAATGIGNPSCAFVSTDHVACAVRSGGSQLMVNVFNGTKWGTWMTLSGTVSSDPSCTSNGGGKVICGATASSGSLEVATYNGTTWSTPTTVTAALFSAPSCAELPSDEVVCVARNSAGGLAWSVFNGTMWSAFANVATTAISAPSCTTDNNSGVVCAVYTKANATLVNRFFSGRWSSFLNLSGIAGGNPDCTSLNSAGKVTCFAKAYTSEPFVNLFNGKTWTTTDWSGYEGLGGATNDIISCTSQIPGDLVCSAIGALDTHFYANVFNGTSWTGWIQEGGTTAVGIGSPSCAPLGTGQVICVVVGATNKLSSIIGP